MDWSKAKLTVKAVLSLGNSTVKMKLSPLTLSTQNELVEHRCQLLRLSCVFPGEKCRSFIESGPGIWERWVMAVIRVLFRLCPDSTHRKLQMTDLLCPSWSILALLFGACYICGTLSDVCMLEWMFTFSRPAQVMCFKYGKLWCKKCIRFCGLL